MKKNTMMRIASVLLVAVLLSTCTISGTFAKYVTEDSGMDKARVAKFGVVVDVAGTMFAEKYDSVGNGNDSVITAGAVTVEADGSHGITNDLVAPGTKGDMAAIKLSGKPEVDVIVTYEATTVDLSGWSVAGENGDEYYCPLVITINGTPYYLSTCASEEAAENQIKSVINSYFKVYNANTDLATQAAENLTISWEWPFETVINGSNCDTKDTYLGNSAAGLNNGKSAATIEIEVKCTVTQID